MLRGNHDHPRDYQELVPPHGDFNFAEALRWQRRCEVEIRLVYATTNTQLKDTPSLWATVADTPSLFTVLKTVLADQSLHLAIKRHHRLQMPRDIKAVTVKVCQANMEWTPLMFDYAKYVGEDGDIDLWSHFRRMLLPDKERRRLNIPVPVININLQSQPSRTNWVPPFLQEQSETPP